MTIREIDKIKEDYVLVKKLTNVKTNCFVKRFERDIINFDIGQIFYNEENQIRIEFSISEGKMIDKLKTLVYNYKSIFSFKMVATNPHGIESCFILVVKRLTDQKINDFFIELMKIII